MRNSDFYARKIRKLLGGARRVVPPAAGDRIRLMLMAVLEENATVKQVQTAMAALEQEFADFNELRVSPMKDIVDVIGRDFPFGRAKAEAMVRSLNATFDRMNALSLDYLAKQTKREVRHTLREELGLSPYAESVVTLYGFSGHAVPVDEYLLAALKADGLVHPESDLPDLQGFLERIVPAKDAAATHEALREYVARNARRVAPEVAKLAKARLAAEAARAEAAPKAAPPQTFPEGLAQPQPEEDESPPESPRKAPAHAAAAKPSVPPDVKKGRRRTRDEAEPARKGSKKAASPAHSRK